MCVREIDTLTERESQEERDREINKILSENKASLELNRIQLVKTEFALLYRWREREKE